MSPPHALIAILPCTDLEESVAFYAKLGFVGEGDDPQYRMVEDADGACLHLTKAEEGWLVPGRNPFGLYLYAENVDALAARFSGEALIAPPQDTPWGMYECALSDPDQTLVRVGWPSHLRGSTAG